MSDSDDGVKTTKRTKPKGKAKAARSTPTRTLPAFLQKLYTIVSDPELDDRIHWSENGDSFVVPSQEKVSHEILPQYFKHSNFGSFVRQLNMYGFRKIPRMQSGALATSYGTNELEFRHDCASRWHRNLTHTAFKRDHPELLMKIERKKAEGDEKGGHASENLHGLLARLEAVSERQESLSQEFDNLAATNTRLWEEQQEFKTKYEQQQRTINAIVQFLAANYKDQIQIDGSTNAHAGAAIDRITQLHEKSLAPPTGGKTSPRRALSFNRLLLEGPDAPSRLQELRNEAGPSEARKAIAAATTDSPNSQNGDGRFSTLPDSPPNGSTEQSALFSNLNPDLSAAFSAMTESHRGFGQDFDASRALPPPPNFNAGALVPYARPLQDIQADMNSTQTEMDQILAEIDAAGFGLGTDETFTPVLSDWDLGQYLSGSVPAPDEQQQPITVPPIKQEEVEPVFDAPTPRTRSKTAASPSPAPGTRTSPRKRASSTAGSESKRSRV